MKVSPLAKRMIITIVGISALFVVASFIYYRSLAFLPFLLGTLLGTGVSIWKVFVLERAVDRALGMDKKKAGNYVSLQQLFRLFVTGVVLFTGAVVPQVSLWGVAAGIIAFQLALYLEQLIYRRK
ncbi:ATP synthase subunit I [Jeotgalibaca porci]|uniref:ATP synthase subunit I n=1 Tax=Jeotgalibaca porci TaxID=1868793 RepID=UPI00359F919E